MEVVALTALGVGGATVFGAVLGFSLKKITHRLSDIVLAFAAGIMMAAAVMGLILPSLEAGGEFALLYTISGIFCGALCIKLIDKLVPHLHRVAGADIEDHENNKKLSKILLFVLAIAIHNFPEGIAAGVGFGSGNNADAFVVAGGIALQNSPEGMVIIAPLLAAGVSARKTFLLASMTGVVEVIGTFVGYFAVSLSAAVLPFALAFAGGTMLYVISDEMIPETHHESATAPTFSLLLGFCVMLVTDFYLG